MINPDTVDFEQPVAGQAFTSKMGSMPFERPAEHTNPAEALAVFFERLSSPAITSKTINMMEAGIPVDLIVTGLSESMAGEGFAHPMTVMQMVPAMTVMLMRMADAAGVKPMLTSDFAGEAGRQIDDSDLDIARLKASGGFHGKTNKAVDVEEKSKKELSELSTGLVARPEGVV